MDNNRLMQLFLIDDDEDDKELLQMALEDTGVNITCVWASGGSIALNMLREGSVAPDFIFLDLNMPEMDGRECLALLKENTATATIPVVIFSTSSETRDIEETRNLGAVDFITKPSKISELTTSLIHFFNVQKPKSFAS